MAGEPYCRVAPMKRLALILAVAACSKSGKDPQPHAEMGATAAMFDPANLPPAGTAPAPVTVTKELDPMWNVPIKTLKGKDTTLASYKGKALMLVNVASKCGNT